VERADGGADRDRQMRGCLSVGGDPSIHLAPQLEVVSALFVEEQTACRLLVLQRLVKKRLDPTPPLGIHDCLVLLEPHLLEQCLKPRLAP
jgi:hypothetical protein